jgi:hypothetical protein
MTSQVSEHDTELAQEEQELPAEDKLLEDDQAPAPEDRALAEEDQELPAEEDQELPAEEEQELPEDDWELSAEEEQALAREEQELARKDQAIAPEDQEPAGADDEDFWGKEQEPPAYNKTAVADLAELAARFETVCQSAVDPLEIASALEFEGVSDRTARSEYEVEDVFALARLLYTRVPRKPGAPAPQLDPWLNSRPLLHGLLYALPAVCFPAAGALLAGPGVLPALVVALLSGWGLSQGLAAVGYLRLGTSGSASSRRVLRDGLVCCLAVVAIIMTITMLEVHAHPTVILFGAGEAAYMLGAGVLLVTGEEYWLPAALAPGVTGAAVFLILGQPPHLKYQTWAWLAATPLLACAVAFIRTGRAGPRADRLSRTEALAVLPAAVLGVTAAGLLTFPVVAGVTGHGGGNIGVLVASVPLALSMGVAEWSLLRYRRATRRLLGRTDDPAWFRRRAKQLLCFALGRYLLGTLVLIGAAVSVAALTGQVKVDATILLSVGGYLMLAAAMFLVLLLQSLWIRLLPLAAAVATLCAELALRPHGLPVQVAAPAVLLAAVGSYALARLGSTVLHA